MSFVDVIGVISGVLGIVQFAEDNFPAPQAAGSSVRMAVGLDSAGGLTNAGGRIPDVALWNEVGGYLGESTQNGYIADGETAEFTVDQSSGQQATYALFSGGNDAVCVAYTSITWPDGNNYAISGDWGQACGGTWYYSNIYIQNSNYKPKCMWLDANGDQPKTAFQVHFPEFRTDQPNEVPANKSIDYLCNSLAPFKFYTTAWPTTIDYWTNGDGSTTSSASIPASSKAKRDTKRAETKRDNKRNVQARFTRRADGPGALANALVVTTATDHSAKDLCGSKTSSGPDLLNTSEKLFCRMSDKTTFPMCDTITTDNCFDSKANSLIVGGKATRAVYTTIWDWTKAGTSTVSSPAKSGNTRREAKYNDILDWSTPGNSTTEPVAA